MRLFVAAGLPELVRAVLAGWGREWSEAGGWRGLPEESLHLTLAFLGEKPAEVAGEVAGALGRAARPVGPLVLGTAVLLPPRRPRVVAVRLEGSLEDLVALQAAVSAELAALGVYEPERRPYLPHVTVARRARGPAGAAGTFEPDGGEFPLTALTLYESRLSPRGARYEPLASVALPVAAGRARAGPPERSRPGPRGTRRARDRDG